MEHSIVKGFLFVILLSE